MDCNFIKRTLIIISTIIFSVSVCSCRNEDDLEGVRFRPGYADVLIEEKEYDINNAKIKYYYAFYEDEIYSNVYTWDTDYIYNVIYFSKTKLHWSESHRDKQTFLEECLMIKKIQDVINDKYIYTIKTNSCNRTLITYNTFEEIVIPSEMFIGSSGMFWINFGNQKDIARDGEFITSVAISDTIYYEIKDNGKVKLWVDSSKNYTWRYNG